MSGEHDVPTADEQGRRDLSAVTLEAVIRPLAIAAMMGCIAVSLGQLLSLFVYDWPARFFTVAALVVSFETIHSRRVLARLEPHRQDRLRFHFVEWVVILLALRLGVYIEWGWPRLAADAARWTTDIGALFDGVFVGGAAMMALFWALAGMLTEAFREIETSPIELQVRATDPTYYLRSTMPYHGQVDRQALLRRVAAIFWSGGALLLVLAGLTRADLGYPQGSPADAAGIILNVLAYFLIGFLLISQAQYAVLQAYWQLQGIPVLGHPGRRWAIMAMIMLMAVGLGAALLPVGYSVGILDVAVNVIEWVVYVFVQVAMVLVFVLSLIIGFILRLFSFRDDPVTDTMPRAVPPPPLVTQTGGEWEWWGLVRSLLFWTILLGIVGYSLYHFIIYRAVPIPQLWRPLARFLNWLRGLGRGLQRGTQRAVSHVRREIRRALAARRERRGALRRRISWRQMDERQRIRYLYLSILQRSDRQGLGRPSARTPLEHEGRLASALPDAADEVQRLTAAFVEARYSDHAVASEDVDATRDAWRTIRRALRRHDTPAVDES